VKAKAGEGGEGAIPGDEDFDDESNLSLSAMEAALKPQVLETLDQIAALYKRLGKLQDAQVEAALARRSFPPARSAVSRSCANETVELVKSLRLNNNRIEALVDQMYASIAGCCRWKGGCCALPKRRAWIASISSAIFWQ